MFVILFCYSLTLWLLYCPNKYLALGLFLPENFSMEKNERNISENFPRPWKKIMYLENCAKKLGAKNYVL